MLTSHIAPKAWKQPLEFLPERWAADSDLIINKSAFAPFSVGMSSFPSLPFSLSRFFSLLSYHRTSPSPPIQPTSLTYLVHSGRYGCIGKNLALMELRTVCALLVSKFDASFAPGEDGTRLLEKSEDYFTIGLESLMLQFKAR